MTQVRASAQALIRFAKKSGACLILVGHVTKDGQIAGPRVVEHMVDAVLSFEGEGSQQFRILRAVKNRFGPTDEIGVFEMTGLGLREVSNPSELFLSERDLGSPGTAVFAGIEGTRPVLVELQALVAPTSLGTPRRAVVGWDTSRLAMVLAVLEAHCGVKLSGHDVYLNVAGGLRINEPAADLAAAAALVSSLTNAPLPTDAVYFGEISLSGAIRPVAQASARLKEAAKLGFGRAILPESARGDAQDAGMRLEQIGIAGQPCGRDRRARRWKSPLNASRSAQRTSDGTAFRRLYTRREAMPFERTPSFASALTAVRVLRTAVSPPSPRGRFRVADLRDRRTPKTFQDRTRPRHARNSSRCHRAGRDAAVRPAGDDPRLHARNPLDRGLGHRRHHHALLPIPGCCRSPKPISTMTPSRPVPSSPALSSAR